LLDTPPGFFMRCACLFFLFFFLSFFFVFVCSYTAFSCGVITVFISRTPLPCCCAPPLLRRPPPHPPSRFLVHLHCVLRSRCSYWTVVSHPTTISFFPPPPRTPPPIPTILPPIPHSRYHPPYPPAIPYRGAGCGWDCFLPSRSSIPLGWLTTCVIHPHVLNVTNNKPHITTSRPFGSELPGLCGWRGGLGGAALDPCEPSNSPPPV